MILLSDVVRRLLSPFQLAIHGATFCEMVNYCNASGIIYNPMPFLGSTIGRHVPRTTNDFTALRVIFSHLINNHHYMKWNQVF